MRKLINGFMLFSLLLGCSPELDLTYENVRDFPKHFEGKKISLKGYLYDVPLLKLLHSSNEAKKANKLEVTGIYVDNARSINDEYIEQKCDDQNIVIDGTVVRYYQFAKLINITQVYSLDNQKMCWTLNGD